MFTAKVFKKLIFACIKKRRFYAHDSFTSCRNILSPTSISFPVFVIHLPVHSIRSMINEKRNEGETQGQVTSRMAWLLLASVLMSSANNLLYKATLNAFSSPTTNYAFFASQFSNMMYTIQAIVVSSIIIANKPGSYNEIFKTPASVFVKMGLLDSASATMGAIAGANCPGMLQTILNQLIIPMTMVGAYFFLKSRLESFQIWGSLFIVIGAMVASLSYLFVSDSSDDTDIPNYQEGHADRTNSNASTAIVTAAVILYFISEFPGAFSNVYKESKMKEQDMHEVHTTTLVSWWQLWFGFLFLPLMAIPALGGLSYREITMQLSDGWTCFRGTNPNDPEGDCSNAAYLLMAYIVVNFVCNIIMLVITKHGSAVLLVVSQALSLPVTNIAFTLKIFMGDSAEPLSAVNLIGLVLVCIGFLTYSGVGLAQNFMVAQGPPGQMAYVHFEDVSEVIVSTELATRPDQLVSFLVSSILQQQTTQQAHRVRTHSMDAAAAANEEREETGEAGAAEGETGESARLLGSAQAPYSSHPPVRRSRTKSRSNSGVTPLLRDRTYSSIEAPRSPLSLISSNESPEPPSTNTATRAALAVAKQAVQLLEAQLDAYDLVVEDSSRRNSVHESESQLNNSQASGFSFTAPIVFKKEAEQSINNV